MLGFRFRVTIAALALALFPACYDGTSHAADSGIRFSLIEADSGEALPGGAFLVEGLNAPFSAQVEVWPGLEVPEARLVAPPGLYGLSFRPAAESAEIDPTSIVSPNPFPVIVTPGAFTLVRVEANHAVAEPIAGLSPMTR